MGAFRGINRDPLFELSDLIDEKRPEVKNSQERHSPGLFYLLIDSKASLITPALLVS